MNDKINIKSAAVFNAYGMCPICRAYGVIRERRLDGNDTCQNGHTYKSATAICDKPAVPFTPTVPGWYWIKRENYQDQPFYVYAVDIKHRCCFSIGADFKDCTFAPCPKPEGGRSETPMA